MLEKEAFRVALLNYTYGTNGLPVPSGCRVNGIDTTTIRREIASARQDGATHVALFVHWGNEYERLPGPRQRELAAAFHRWGADLVIGSHPHVVQRRKRSRIRQETYAGRRSTRWAISCRTSVSRIRTAACRSA